MNVLFIGDIVGPAATAYVAERLPELRQDYSVDLVVANAENCAVTGPVLASGFGMTLELIELLLEGGVDVITSGNHAWDGSESDRVLNHPRVLRPYNLPRGTPGKGVTSLDVGGEPVTVINLVSATAIPKALPVYKSWLSAALRGTVIVDFHGETVSEKQAFAFAVDGEAAAVLGTHTHEATLHLHRLPGGTALVTEVGMTGPMEGILGIDPRHFVASLKGEDLLTLPPFTLAGGSTVLGAVLMRIEAGRTQEIKRLS